MSLPIGYQYHPNTEDILKKSADLPAPWMLKIGSSCCRIPSFGVVKLLIVVVSVADCVVMLFMVTGEGTAGWLAP